MLRKNPIQEMRAFDLLPMGLDTLEVEEGNVSELGREPWLCAARGSWASLGETDEAVRTHLGSSESLARLVSNREVSHSQED